MSLDKPRKDVQNRPKRLTALIIAPLASQHNVHTLSQESSMTSTADIIGTFIAFTTFTANTAATRLQVSLCLLGFH